MIDSMLAHGIKPYATVFHWDLPQVSSCSLLAATAPGTGSADVCLARQRAPLHSMSVTSSTAATTAVMLWVVHNGRQLLNSCCLAVAAALVIFTTRQQVLQDSYNGFVDSRIVDDFVNFADTLFAAFGDRVKDWMTFNEPWITCALQVHTWWWPAAAMWPRVSQVVQWCRRCFVAEQA